MYFSIMCMHLNAEHLKAKDSPTVCNSNVHSSLFFLQKVTEIIVKGGNSSGVES